MINSRVFCWCTMPGSEAWICCTGDRLHENSRSWLSPPDPSDNRVIARRDNHDGSAVWLTRGSTFEKWNVNGCLLWIYGKRTWFEVPHAPGNWKHLITFVVTVAGSGKSILWWVLHLFSLSSSTNISRPVPPSSRRPWRCATRDWA